MAPRELTLCTGGSFHAPAGVETAFEPAHDTLSKDLFGVRKPKLNFNLHYGQ
jgi:hypothetical protein